MSAPRVCPRGVTCFKAYKLPTTLAGFSRRRNSSSRLQKVESYQTADHHSCWQSILGYRPRSKRSKQPSKVHAGLCGLGDPSGDETNSSIIEGAVRAAHQLLSPTPRRFAARRLCTSDGSPKENPTEVLNLHPPTLSFASSNQFQTRFLNNFWRFGCLPSDKSSRQGCI
jgi:hypothetical protein